MLCQSTSGKGDAREEDASHFRSRVRSQPFLPDFSSLKNCTLGLSEESVSPTKRGRFYILHLHLAPPKLPVSRSSQSVAPELLSQEGGMFTVCSFHASGGMGLLSDTKSLPAVGKKTPETAEANISGVPGIQCWKSCNSGKYVR